MPQVSGGSGGPALTWNITNTIGSLPAGVESEPIYVDAVFQNGATHYTSPTVLVTYNAGTVDNGDATDTAGPCIVSLWTGSCEIHSGDVSVQTPNQGDLGVDRTFVSNSVPASGPFGQGWASSLPTDAAGVDALIDTSSQTSLTGEVEVEGPDSDVTFVPTGSAYALTSGETGDETLTKSGSGASATWIYTEPSSTSAGSSDDQEITFNPFSTPGSAPSTTNPWKYLAATVEPTGPDGAADAVAETFNATTGYPTQMLGPQPSGVTCDVSWAVGCEALNFTYNANNEVSKATLETANASGAPVYTDVACYAYDSNKRLYQEWDPRTASSTCNFSSPTLATTYTYNSSGQVVTDTPPGLEPWTITYTSNEVTKVSRTHSATYGSATQATQFLYNAPIGGTTSNAHPDLSPATDSTWGQYDDPVTGTAVFGPGTTYSTSDLRPATVYALDASGYEVNVANFDGTTQAGWDVSTSQYDQYGNDVMDLTPQNRASVEADNCAVAGLPSGCSQTILANALATISKYSAAGLDLLKVFQPTSTTLVAYGTQTVGRPVSQDTYGTVNYPTVDPSDYSAGGPLDDIVSEVTGTSEGAASVVNAETDERTTTYAYGLTSTDHSGWDYGTPVSTDVAMSGTDIVRQTVIDDSTGETTQVRQPSAQGSSTSPATTTMTYYTAGTTNIANCVDTAWVGMPCTDGPGSQPTGEAGMPGLPVTQVTSYDYLLRPVTTVATVTDASGSQQTKTTAVAYENSGLATEESSTSTTGGLGTALPTQDFYYSSSTDLPTVESTTGATNCSSSGPLCTSYDDFGNQISFTDSSGATTVTSPTINDQPGTITLKTAGGATIQTATYVYAAGNEYRDVPTSVSYAGGSGYSSVGTYTAAYNADGALSQETLPDGSVLQQSQDNEGNQTSKIYMNSSTDLYAEVDEAYNSHDETVQVDRPDVDNFINYSYDNDGRLQQVQDLYANGQCSTRTYTLDVDSNRTRMKTYPAVAGGGCSTGTSPTIQALNYDSSDRITSGASASGIAYDAFGRTTTIPATLVAGGSSESLGYYSDDQISTLTQGSTTQTWTLDPDHRDYTSAQSGSTSAMVDHYSDSTDDSPSWSSITNSAGVTATSVSDEDLTGQLAATTSDTTGAPSIQYDLTNPEGDVIGTANPASPTEVVTPILTDEFGNPTDIDGNPTGGPRYGWLGGDQADSSSLGGVVMMGVRGYLPSIGRFVSVDSVLGGNDGPYVYPTDPIDGNDLTGELSSLDKWSNQFWGKVENWMSADKSKASEIRIVARYWADLVGGYWWEEQPGWDDGTNERADNNSLELLAAADHLEAQVQRAAYSIGKQVVDYAEEFADKVSELRDALDDAKSFGPGG